MAVDLHLLCPTHLYVGNRLSFPGCIIDNNTCSYLDSIEIRKLIIFIYLFILFARFYSINNQVKFTFIFSVGVFRRFQIEKLPIQAQNCMHEEPLHIQIKKEKDFLQTSIIFFYSLICFQLCLVLWVYKNSNANAAKHICCQVYEHLSKVVLSYNFIRLETFITCIGMLASSLPYVACFHDEKFLDFFLLSS